MYKFERNQDKMREFVVRQHSIPPDVYKYAVLRRLEISKTRNHGVGGRNIPTLADIYERLTVEGLKVLQSPSFEWEFEEVGKPEGAVQVRIKFSKETDAEMRSFQNDIGAAHCTWFTLVPGPGYQRKVSQISLVSIAVNCMRIAIEMERKNLYKNALVDFYKDKGIAEKEAKSAAFATIVRHKKDGMPEKIKTQ